MNQADEESDEFDLNQEEIDEAANVVSLDLLPKKSRVRYQNERLIFLKWCKQKKVKSFTENVLLVYFSEKSKTLKPSTLWCSFSMLKSTLIIEDNVDISKFSKLIAFLKQKAVGHRPKKSLTFSKEDVARFIREAPDEDYLMMKV